MQTNQFLLYGANGYTGQLIAKLAETYDLNPILAGRNEKAIQQLSEDLQLPYRIVDLDNAAELQKKAQTMTPQEQEAAMNEMNEMQQNLQIRKQNSDNELLSYNSKMNDDILNRIQNFLKKYNSDGKYSYVFSYQPGLMFYKDSTLDITADVIKGLNELDAEKKK